MSNKAARIAIQIQEKIDLGEYDSKLPAEPNLVEAFETSLITIRQALGLLEKQGTIYRVRRVGTFVKRRGKKKLRVGLRSPNTFVTIIDDLKAAVKNKFTGFEVEFFQPNSNEFKPEWQADLLIVTSGGMLDFREFAQPFAAGTMAKFLNDDYIQPPFDTYRIDTSYYALPLLFSPSMIRYRREFASELDACLMTGEFSRKKAERIAGMAESRQMLIWGFSDVFSCFWSSMFAGDGEKKAALLDPVRTVEMLKQFQPMLIPDLISLSSGEAEPTLLHRHLRQFRGDYSAFQVTVPPWGCNCIAGEFILLPRGGTNAEEALQLAEFLLSPEIQTIIGKHNLGIPVHKHSAWDSLSGGAPFSELFFRNIAGMVNNNAAEYNFMLRCKELILAMTQKEISATEMFDAIGHEIVMGKRRQENLKNKFLFI